METAGRALRRCAEIAREAGVFGSVEERGGMIECAAKEAAAPAWYRVEVEGDRAAVSLVMADRWLSHSIEADLLHTGDKMEDLLDEELVELGVKHGGREVQGLRVEHYRSEDKLFTFRTPLPWKVEEMTPETLAGCLLAYEACFRGLGDMEAGDEA